MGEKKAATPAALQFEFPANSVSQSKTFAWNQMDAQHEFKLQLCRIVTENFPIHI
jgi:hypothetical protein